MTDMAQRLLDEPDERLSTLKEIRAWLISQQTFIGNLKKMLGALKQCLAFQQSNVRRLCV